MQLEAHSPEEPTVAGLTRVELPYLDRISKRGTANAYIISKAPRALLVDAGFAGDSNFGAVLAAWEGLGKPKIERIVLTHGHLDHIGGASAFAEYFSAEVVAHPAAIGDIAHRDPALLVKPALNDETMLNTPIGPAQVIHSPGHSPGDICLHFPSQRLLISGDVVLSRSSTLISPPGGDMTRYLSSLRRLLSLDFHFLAPGHGPIIEGGWDRTLGALEHRVRREGEILGLLRQGSETDEEIAHVLYGESARVDLGIRLVQCYLVHLATGGWVEHEAGKWKAIHQETSG